MRPVQHTGRAGTPVIPAAWSQAPRTVFAKTRTAWCSIRHPGAVKSGPLNQATGTYPMEPPAPHFTGSARVQALSTQATRHLVAEDDVTTTGYLVAVSLDAAQVQVDDVVTVTAFDDNGDPLLPDHELIVRSIATGSLAWERDLICTDNQG